MSECRYAPELGPYHDGELPAAAAAELEKHLGGCPACAAELERIRALSGILGSARPTAMPPAALDRLHCMVDRLPGASVRRMAEAFAAVAAVVLLACSLALATLSAGPKRDESIPLWELTAVSHQRVDASSADGQEQLAMWTVQDLLRKNSHD